MFLTIENYLFTAAMAVYLGGTALFFLFAVTKKERHARIAGVLITVGFVFHTLALVVRGIGAGRLPMANQYEFATSFAWGICLCFLVFYYRYRFYALGVFAAPILFLVIGYAAMQSREVRELMPALRSSWLGIHVSAAIIAYGAFGVSCAVSLVFLCRTRLLKNKAWESYIPEEETLDRISYRAVSLGFLFLTFVMITGAIWAERAWGSYWSWDPKETLRISRRHILRTGQPLHPPGFCGRKPAGKNLHPPFPEDPGQWYCPPAHRPDPPESALSGCGPYPRPRT